MGILKRFTNIMSANINGLLQKSNDPEKMISEYLRQIESDLGNVKAESATVVAEEKRTKRALNECMDEISKMDRYADRARRDGESSRAIEYEDRKEELVLKEKTLKSQYELALENTNKMNQMEEKLSSDLMDLKNRMINIKNTLDNAKAISEKNTPNLKKGSVASNVSKLEEEADKKLFQAKALEELNNLSKEDDDEEFNRLFEELEKE